MIKKDDLIDLYNKVHQRGLSFVRSKFSFNEKSRTLSAFNDSELFAAHWWIIPQVKARWNKLITGDPKLSYENYFMEKYCKNKTGLRLLSIGSGVCSHEMILASHSNFAQVHCMDISDKLIQKAQAEASEKGLDNMQFEVADIYTKELKASYYDIVLFHASLHHFKNIESLLSEKIKATLKADGLIMINEYVGPNRMQFPKKQVHAINQAIGLIPGKFKTRYKSNTTKASVSGPGLWRMIVADPSECVESENILSALRANFKCLEEKPYGGNILMYALKDIAHHFLDQAEESNQVLEDLFAFEDDYLRSNASDFLFGLYRNTITD